MEFPIHHANNCLCFLYELFLLNKFNQMTFTSFTGKRRALIPPSAGYINENLKPIPDEVLPSFNSLKLWFPADFCIPDVWFSFSPFVSFLFWQAEEILLVKLTDTITFVVIYCSLALVEAFCLMQMSLWYLRCSSWKYYEFIYDIFIQVLLRIHFFVALIKLLELPHYSFILIKDVFYDCYFYTCLYIFISSLWEPGCSPSGKQLIQIVSFCWKFAAAYRIWSNILQVQMMQKHNR